jgi:hypothetical protein
MIGTRNPNPQTTAISVDDTIHTEGETYTVEGTWSSTDDLDIPYAGGVKATTEDGYVTFIPYRTIKTCRDCGTLTLTDRTCPDCYH